MTSVPGEVVGAWFGLRFVVCMRAIEMRSTPAALLLGRLSRTSCRRCRGYAMAILPALAIWQIGPASGPALAQQATATRSTASDAKCEVITRAQVARLAAGGNLIDILRTRFPGLLANDADWTPRSASSFGLRGQNSLTGSGEPLIFLDGMRLPQPGGLGQLELIEPLHVQRMEILPGPAASANFGTGASNGVILIYTQTGSNTTGSDPRGGCPF
jgi:outer membrane cobalamin receptor